MNKAAEMLHAALVAVMQQFIAVDSLEDPRVLAEVLRHCIDGDEQKLWKQVRDAIRAYKAEVGDAAE